MKTNKQIIILFSFLTFLIQAQTPQAFKYQAVARDNSGNVMVNQNIGFRISILQGSPTGSAVYAETHTVASNDFGLVNFDIGAGNVLSGSISAINWGASTYFTKIEMDANGGTNYLFIGTSQLLSVPYALHAETANNVLNGGANYNAGNGIAIANNTITNTAPDQSVSITGNNGIIVSGSYPNFTLSSSGGGGNSGTLDQAYDFGGSGLGRSITTDAGAVQINNSGSNTTGLEVNSSVTNSTGVLANVTGIGVGLRAESTNPSNSFASIQANTNSSNAQNSAILGNNSGGGYGISGQIPSNATGLAAVYGNNLRTSGGYGIYGQGFNGVVGQTTSQSGFGVYGGNSNTSGGTTSNLGIGVYGIGFNGIYGQTTNTTSGWAGYFTADLGCDGAGYALGGWINASDRRLKSDIKKIDNALSKLSLLDGKFYTLTTKSGNPEGKVQLQNRTQYGIIAQDLEKIFPEMVSEKAIFINAGDDTKYKTVEYTQLIPVLIEAVKELNLKVEDLQKEVNSLKASGKK
ncbi:MAG: tail fiber domain-containing protein [Bacteroidota bacterium]|jgi:hypothetical protein